MQSIWGRRASPPVDWCNNTLTSNQKELNRCIAVRERLDTCSFFNTVGLTGGCKHHVTGEMVTPCPAMVLCYNCASFGERMCKRVSADEMASDKREDGHPDFNECAQSNGGCGENTECIPTKDGHKCVCLPGFAFNGAVCEDINECLNNNGGCDAQANCINLPGGFQCQCKQGYEGDGKMCQLQNQCDMNHGGCDRNSACVNKPDPAIPGSRVTCLCNDGYLGDGRVCVAKEQLSIRDCKDSSDCDSKATCRNDAYGGHFCECISGWEGTGKQCTDINECLEGNGGCSGNATCVNTPGSRECNCNSGFTGDGIVCIPSFLADCSINNGDCDVNARCEMCKLPGCRMRTCTCKAGYMGDGRTCFAVASAYHVVTAPRYIEGDPINVQWNAPEGHSPLDWVGIFPAGRTSFMAGQQGQRQSALPGGEYGTLVFNGPMLPSTPGQYEVVLFKDGTYEPFVRSNIFEILPYTSANPTTGDATSDIPSDVVDTYNYLRDMRLFGNAVANFIPKFPLAIQWSSDKATPTLGASLDSAEVKSPPAMVSYGQGMNGRANAQASYTLIMAELTPRTSQDLPSGDNTNGKILWLVSDILGSDFHSGRTITTYSTPSPALRPSGAQNPLTRFYTFILYQQTASNKAVVPPVQSQGSENLLRFATDNSLQPVAAQVFLMQGL
eukprot:GILJ01000323.1.p1 GENE.GILJ01000323.1~~GILJ01000323.1.p1  ORF type:complete len:764 (-),score=74.11 GILJ01000323.1:223-2232(-)